MSDKKAFATFPGMGAAKFHLIDVFAIEAISQSPDRTKAVIFGPTDRFYSVEVEEAELDACFADDAANYCLDIISEVSRLEARRGQVERGASPE